MFRCRRRMMRVLSYIEFAGWISNGLPWDNADIDSDLTVTANWNETDTFEELITNHGDSEEDAIEIPDLGTLERIRDYVNANTNNHCSGKFFKLTNDIRLPQGWTQSAPTLGEMRELPILQAALMEMDTRLR